MMDMQQYLLGKIAEEAAEVAECLLLVQEYGLYSVAPGQNLPNVKKLAGEFADLITMVNRLANHAEIYISSSAEGRGPELDIDQVLRRTIQGCLTLAQRSLKAQQFGLAEIQRGQKHNNGVRLARAFSDLMGAAEPLERFAALVLLTPSMDAVYDKNVKVDKFSELSRRLGRLEPLAH